MSKPKTLFARVLAGMFADSLRRRLQRKVERKLAGTGFTFLSFGPDAVNVQGDGRVVAPVVLVTPPDGSTSERAGEVCTSLINEVPGITRMLIDISRQT